MAPMNALIARYRRVRYESRPLAVIILVVAATITYAATSSEPQSKEAPTGQKVTTFLMFEGKAEEAMTFYVSLFKNAKIKRIQRYGAGEPGPEGSVKHAVFSIEGQEFMCSDSYVQHDFTFTPATSLFVTCESEAEVDQLFATLSTDGKVLMPLASYPFSRKFAWVADRYGVSWQLNLPNE